MATITAQNIIDRVQIVLQDNTGTRWPVTTELLGWLNDGQREVALLKPESSVTSSTETCAAGTKQTLPATGLMLIDVIRNGSTGKAVRQTERRILDEQIPTWHGLTGSATVDLFAFDPRNPKVYWVYPPATTAATLEIIYSVAPADCATVNAVIALDDIYSNALVDYILYRAYSKDTDYAGNDGRAMSHYKQFQQAIGLREQIETATEPKADMSRAPQGQMATR